jgi:molybdopterin converting factor small subunit
MRIRVSFLGTMERFAGQPSMEMELQDNSTLGEAVHKMGKSFGDKFPPEIWDAKQGVFTHRVKIFINSTEVEDLGNTLQDSSEILILVPVAGG